MLYFLTSFVLALLIAPVVISIYKKNKWVDDPQINKHLKVLHSEAVPRGGGLVIFFAVLIPALLFLHVDSYLVAILIGAALLTIVGVIDDIYDISPVLRLIVGFTAALIVVASGIGIAYISNPFGDGVILLNQVELNFNLFNKDRAIWLIPDLFALFFIVWNMNIVNWSKGVDGQMPGFVSIGLLIVGILSFRFIDDPTQFSTAHLSFIASGAFAGLLMWNWYPQKMMPGYGAGSLAGYLLGVTAILSGAKVATTLMVLAIPTADAIFTITRRIVARKSPLKGDRGHLHHKLLDVYGWNKQSIAVFYWTCSLLLGLLSLYLNTTGKMITIALVTIFVFGFLIHAKIRTRKT